MDEKDALFGMFKQCMEQGLHHQQQRSTIANIVLVLSGAIVGLVTFDKEICGPDVIAGIFLIDREGSFRGPCAPPVVAPPGTFFPPRRLRQSVRRLPHRRLVDLLFLPLIVRRRLTHGDIPVDQLVNFIHPAIPACSLINETVRKTHLPQITPRHDRHLIQFFP